MTVFAVIPYRSNLLLLILLISLLSLTACRDNPATPGGGDDVCGIEILDPRPNDVFLTGSSMPIRWKLRAGHEALDSVRVDYRATGTGDNWKILLTSPFQALETSVIIAPDFPERFALRIRGLHGACADSVEPLYASVLSIEPLSPSADQKFIAGAVIPIRWKLRFPEGNKSTVIDAGTVRIEYRVLSEGQNWIPFVEPRAVDEAYDWKLPLEVRSSFELRLRSIHQTDWLVISPLAVIEPQLELLSPKDGETYRLGSVIPIRWHSKAQLGTDSITVCTYYNYSGAHWDTLGTFPYADGGVDWRIPSDRAQDWKVKLLHIASGITAEATFHTAVLELRDFPPPGGLARGSVLSLDVYFRWSKAGLNKLGFLLSTNGGLSWPHSGQLESTLITFPASENCLLRIVHEDSSIEDTSTQFSITEDLDPVPVLRVGEAYVYRRWDIEWRVIAGGTMRIPRERPDVHLFVQRKEETAGGIRYHLLCQQEGGSDSVTVVVEEALSGLHQVRSIDQKHPFGIPFDFPDLYVNLDRQTRQFYYRLGNSVVELDRDRGLVSLTCYSGSYPSMDEYVFQRK